jgi:transcriptional regulator CtsR
MARLSDTIEEFIKSLMQGSDESELQIKRNELASHFSCAPSQINYVLTTRFTCDRGYHIESRRGGGGYIIIKRIECGTRKSLLDSINESIGDNLTYDRGVQIIEGLFELNILSYREGNIMKAAINDRALSIYENRNKVRGDILKGMIMVIMQ